jgi:phytoene/squalene synthetase
LDQGIRNDIYAIYAFVRFADEIVDTFHPYDKRSLLDDFCKQTYLAIDQKISLNPVLHQFQQTVNRFQIDHDLIDAFFIEYENGPGLFFTHDIILRKIYRGLC